MAKIENHTVKTHALPPGWESFQPVELGHPGAGWLSAAEFAKAMGLQVNRANGILRNNSAMDACTRRVNGHVTRFYRPRKA